MEAILTPVAFFEFRAGFHIGTGWPLTPQSVGASSMDRKTGHYYGEGSSLGIVAATYFEGKLQFNLAALIPGIGQILC